VNEENGVVDDDCFPCRVEIRELRMLAQQQLGATRDLTRILAEDVREMIHLLRDRDAAPQQAVNRAMLLLAMFAGAIVVYSFSHEFGLEPVANAIQTIKR
jgi:hypothetical protein